MSVAWVWLFCVEYITEGNWQAASSMILSPYFLTSSIEWRSNQGGDSGIPVFRHSGKPATGGLRYAVMSETQLALGESRVSSGPFGPYSRRWSVLGRPVVRQFQTFRRFSMDISKIFLKSR